MKQLNEDNVNDHEETKKTHSQMRITQGLLVI